MSNIYIIGFMGSGKSYTGKRLAHRLACSFTDLDTLFEDKYHFTIPDFFDRFGEDAFRKIEHGLLQSTEGLTDTVISTGGGTPCFHQNIDFMNANGITIYLKMHPGQILQRLIQSKRPRPLVKNLSGDALEQQVNSLLAQREPYYNEAHITVDISHLNPNDIVDSVIEHLSAYRSGCNA